MAARSHAENFHKTAPLGLFEAHARSRDLTRTEPAQVLQELQPDVPAIWGVDIIAGGPPCQAFARVGRAKLREVAEHPEAFRQDPRGNLYLRYVTYVRELKPLALLMENVPDVINYGGHNIPQEVCELLDTLGYVARYTLLNSAFYGVPQMRERMFLLAYAKEVTTQVRFPDASHWIQLPRGYASSRNVALRHLEPDFFSHDSFYVPPPSVSEDLPAAITAREALADLPTITNHLEGKLRRGARRFDTPIPCPAPKKQTPYVLLMRSWPGFESPGTVSDHVIRYLPRDYPIFRRMNAGDEYPAAHHHAVSLFNEEVSRRRRQGEELGEGKPAYKTLFKAMVPPYDPGKFPNKWRKMESDQPARTLMAHLGKDGYSHIHYDSDQARTISVREAARLQSFPDGFRFSGAMNDAFRQIGNAVPPLMAKALADVIASTLFQSASAIHAIAKHA